MLSYNPILIFHPMKNLLLLMLDYKLLQIVEIISLTYHQIPFL